MILPILSAILGIAAFSPINVYWVAFIFLAPFFLFLLREEKLWRLIAGSLLFRLIFFFGTVYFTLEPILWIEVILISLGLPIAVWTIKKLSIRLLPSAYVSCFLLLLLPFAFTFFDHLQARFAFIPTYIVTAGNALGSSPFIGLASAGGLIALTFFVAIVNLLITAAIFQRRNRRNIISLTFVIVLLLFFAWNFSSLELRKNSLTYNSLPNSFTLAVVSVNNTFAFNSLAGLVQELRSQKTDLIVFPEDIFNQRTFSSVFQNIAKDLNANVLAAYDTFQNGNKYNSSMLFDSQGNIAGLHNKNRLTFIGEYWPFGDWQPSIYKWLREKNPQTANYAIFSQKNAYQPGQQNLLSANFSSGQVLFAAPICLEIQYPNDLKKYKNYGARFIINQSSNRWISAGTGHFLYLTNNLRKIEAVWLGLPIIASGVEDFAGVISPDGQADLINYENNIKNYSIYFGEVKY